MKLLRNVVLLCVTLMSTQALAEKVAVLGVDQAVRASKAAEAFRNQLRNELSAEEAEVAGLEKQAKAAQEKLAKNKGLVSDAEFKKLQLQFQKVFAQYQRKGQALQQKRAQKEQAFLLEMRPKLDKVIRGLIEKDGYDMIVNKQATLFAKKELDITPKVVELLNAQ
ncbi:OmpH family outer membrane protein [Marinobacterium jannaschii]|uniref:OmpH family outer membrane protein n=1 Tax=Marinobacterium jannaschii TaxID=64970 RepID=UPI0004824572|nr:OmpH family outer membrane protein [Marinobacterium jannaschii]